MFLMKTQSIQKSSCSLDRVGSQLAVAAEGWESVGGSVDQAASEDFIFRERPGPEPYGVEFWGSVDRKAPEMTLGEEAEEASESYLLAHLPWKLNFILEKVFRMPL